MCIQKKSKSKYTVDDCVFLCMRNAYNNKRWLMFHEIQRIISEQTGKFFGEATISASIRNMRKDHCRSAYNLPRFGEIVDKRRRHNSRGYEYKFNIWYFMVYISSCSCFFSIKWAI